MMIFFSLLIFNLFLLFMHCFGPCTLRSFLRVCRYAYPSENFESNVSFNLQLYFIPILLFVLTLNYCYFCTALLFLDSCTFEFHVLIFFCCHAYIFILSYFIAYHSILLINGRANTLYKRVFLHPVNSR